jgi:hypothetical protein
VESLTHLLSAKAIMENMASARHRQGVRHIPCKNHRHYAYKVTLLDEAQQIGAHLADRSYQTWYTAIVNLRISPDRAWIRAEAL